MYTTRFSFGSKAPSLFEIGHNLGLFALFLPLRAIFGVGVRFKNFFLTILYRQSTLVLKVQPYLLFSIRPYLGPLLDFFGPLGAFFGTFLGYFWGRGQVQKHFWNLLMQTINFCFGSIAISFCFNFGQILGLFTLFGPFGAIFGVGVRFKNFFGTCLHRLTTFILEVQLYLASLKLSRVAGWVAGRLVGKSDFNENPVVSPDLDLDFGLRLRVCQNESCSTT